jgi:hypothetical protein
VVARPSRSGGSSRSPRRRALRDRAPATTTPT